MESLRSWVVKVEMRERLVIHEVPSTGSADYTEEDVAHMHRRLRDELAFNAPRRLVNATIQDGVLVAFFETPNEPSDAECREFWRLTMQALPVFRRPRAFRCVKTYPVGTTDVAYIG